VAPQPNLFYPEMMHFALPLHATREELIELAAGWAAAHELNVALERFFPDYLVGAVPLEPLSDDGLRATALASKMGDEEKLRWWVGLARESAAGWHRGAWAVDPGGRRKFVSDHWYTPAAYELSVAGVPMLSSHGSATFEFDAPA